MPKVPRILVIGDASACLIAPVPKIPDEGETVPGEDFVYVPGGQGVCAAITIQKLGGRAILCSRIGSDSNAELITGYIKRSGVDGRFITHDMDAKTGFEIILVKDTDQIDSADDTSFKWNMKNEANRCLIYSGANTLISSEDVEYAFTSIPDAVLICCRMLSKSTIRTALLLAQKKKIPVFADTGVYAPDFMFDGNESEYGQLEMFITDEAGAKYYTGHAEIRPSVYLRVFMDLAKKVSAKKYIIRLDNRSVLAYDGKYHHVFPAYDAGITMDVNTAEAAFVAALSYADLLDDRNVSNVCKFAQVAEALTIKNAGAFLSIPEKKEIFDFIEENKIIFDSD